MKFNKKKSSNLNLIKKYPKELLFILFAGSGLFFGLFSGIYLRNIIADHYNSTFKSIPATLTIISICFGTLVAFIFVYLIFNYLYFSWIRKKNDNRYTGRQVCHKIINVHYNHKKQIIVLPISMRSWNAYKKYFFLWKFSADRKSIWTMQQTTLKCIMGHWIIAKSRKIWFTRLLVLPIWLIATLSFFNSAFEVVDVTNYKIWLTFVILFVFIISQLIFYLSFLAEIRQEMHRFAHKLFDKKEASDLIWLMNIWIIYIAIQVLYNIVLLIGQILSKDDISVTLMHALIR